MGMTTGIRLPDELEARFESLASTTGRGKDDLLTEALIRYIEHESRQIGQIEDALRQADAGEFATDAEMRELLGRITTPEGMERARAQVRHL